MLVRALVLVLLLGSLPPPARAEGETVPEVEGLVLDGSLTEAGWEDALALPVGRVQVPIAPGEEIGDGPTVETLPWVGIARQEGWLYIGVRVGEDPGVAMGLRLMVAREGAATAAEAISLGYAPQDIRSPRYAARGPEGPGRSRYGIQGAPDLQGDGRWALEVRIPLSQLAGGSTGPLRVALAVATRTPNVLAWVPEDAAFSGPASWIVLEPPPDGWPARPTDVPSFVDEAAVDAERMAAWSRWLLASATATRPLVSEALARRTSGEGLPQSELRALARELLLAPLEEIARLRPDLAYAPLLQGEVYRELGLIDDAAAAYEAALRIAPSLREALHGLWFRLRGPALAEGPVGGVTDYEAAFAAADALEARADGPFARQGVAFGRGLLHYKHGEFPEARDLLAPLAELYPFQQSVVYHYERARKLEFAWQRELGYRRRDAERDDLPRVRIVTSEGNVVCELFEDDTPNTVQNFVWLADHDFFDGLPFHRVIPFFIAQTGDPNSLEGAQGLPGMGGPGWKISTEIPPDPTTRPRGTGTRDEDPRHRGPFRHMLGMAAAGVDTAGSQFFFTTGTAWHLDGTFAIFGRVLEGGEVVDRLHAGSSIRDVEILRRRPDTTYRPVDVTGSPVPEPRR